MRCRPHGQLTCSHVVQERDDSLPRCAEGNQGRQGSAEVTRSGQERARCRRVRLKWAELCVGTKRTLRLR